VVRNGQAPHPHLAPPYQPPVSPDRGPVTYRANAPNQCCRAGALRVHGPPLVRPPPSSRLTASSPGVLLGRAHRKNLGRPRLSRGARGMMIFTPRRPRALSITTRLRQKRLPAQRAGPRPVRARGLGGRRR
jgi:hypothetical protein